MVRLRLMTTQPEDPHVERVSKISFRVGEQFIHIVGDQLPEEDPLPNQDRPLPKLGPGPTIPIRIQLRLDKFGPGSELNLDDFIERATAEKRDMIIHISQSET